MYIYEIDRQLESLIDPETGELLDYEAFEQLQMERDKKVENMALWYKDLAAQAEAIKAEEKALSERRAALEKKRDRLKAYIENATQGAMFETGKVKISYRKSKACEITDEEALKAAWASGTKYASIFTVAAPKVNKTELTKLLKSGAELEGAQLIEKNNISIK